MRFSICSVSLVLCGLVSSLLFVSCGEDDDMPGVDNDLISGTYDPQVYEFDIPEWLPDPIVAANNPLTQEGVELGRRLFFDPILSVDSTMSCSSCHDPSLAFTDGLARSLGVMGLEGKRSAMSLVNLAFNPRGFFWDGRSESLERQAIDPVIDHMELADTWENVLSKLQRHSDYPTRFKASFGIDRKSEITRDLAVKAIAQFETTLISGHSEYDRVSQLNDGFLSDEEERGRELFFIEFAVGQDHPGCSHCHFYPLFTDNQFKNNGLDDVESLADFPDLGRGGVNGNIFDNGKFRVPTLRNIAEMAPYMHDGRFATLEEVVEHYAAGGHGVENEDGNIQPFAISEADKAALVAFMKTLSDPTFLQNPQHASPF